MPRAGRRVSFDSQMTITPWRTTFAASLVLLALTLPSTRSAAQGNGIFADFTTSMGAFTCQLDFTNAPRTVANFIGLATGQRAWLDLPSGRARTNAFYNGLTFHRVIAGFMIQGGSPNGIGTDGPGYAFTDEFNPSLIFDSFGVLAMANSGPDSDGSQFFVTVAPYPTGNNVYSIFGRLTSGSNVVYAINHVPTDPNNKPFTPVVIQQVGIRLVGSAALAFNINAYNLPLVTNLMSRISNSVSQVALTFTNRLYADNRLYTCTNLGAAWTAQGLGIEITSSFTNRLQITKDTPRKFFRMAQIQYPSSTFSPKAVYGKNLALTFTNTITGILNVVFDSAGGGTFTYSPGGSGTVLGYAWAQEPYRGRFVPIILSSVFDPMLLLLNFSSASAGAFTGTGYPFYPYTFGAYPVTGTFTYH